MDKMLQFIEMIARLTKDGEGEEGEESVMENDDAVNTLNDLISQARDLVATAADGSDMVLVAIPREAAQILVNDYQAKIDIGIQETSDDIAEELESLEDELIIDIEPIFDALVGVGLVPQELPDDEDEEDK